MIDHGPKQVWAVSLAKHLRMGQAHRRNVLVQGCAVAQRCATGTVEAYRAAADGQTVVAPEEPKDVRIDLPVDGGMAQV